MRRLVLFDVDGTLLLANGAGRAAFRTALREIYGETGAIDGFHFHGMTDPGIVYRLLRPLGRGEDWIESGLERLWRSYVSCLQRELAGRRGRLGPLPGVAGLLKRLAADGRFVCALVTGNVAEGAWAKLRACGLANTFAFGAFGSDSAAREDLPPLAMQRAEVHTGVAFRSEEVIVVGDTPEDIRCARAAGVRVLAVATGRHTVEELRRHEPDAILPDLTDHDAVIGVLAG